MKLTVQQVSGAEKEVIIRCGQVDEEVAGLLALLSEQERRLQVFHQGDVVLLRPSQVLYCESVDGRTYVYTGVGVYDTRLSLREIGEAFAPWGFFRCAKSMVVNLHAVERLKSCGNGRILAVLENGERIMVSRKYAGLLREALRLTPQAPPGGQRGGSVPRQGR